MPHEWKISLQLKPTKDIESWKGLDNNVIFLTTGYYWEKPRPPRVYLGRHGVFKIWYGVNNKAFALKFLESASLKLKKGEWVELEMSQEMKDGKLLYRVKIDGAEKYSVENKTPKIFQNVKLITGFDRAPCFKKKCVAPPFKGSIRELSVKIKKDDAYMQMTG